MTGVESEAPLGYAALHRLVLGFLGLVEHLPAPQRHALESTFGLVAGPPPDRFLVGLGVLTLLAEAASGDGLLCIVDDAEWLDPESAVVLGFVARRLQAEGVVMVFGARELSEVAPALQGLAEVVIGALDDGDAAALLAMVAPGKVSPSVAARLVAEGGGNPLALVELAAELTPAQLAGSADLPDPLPAAGSLQQMFSRRLGSLSPDARLLLAIAAAEPTAPDAVVRGAANQLAVDADEVAAELSGLAELGLRSRSATPSCARSPTTLCRWRGAARSTGRWPSRLMRAPSPTGPAWHLAMAATGPDEALAARLVEVAGAGIERGGYAANATFLARAAELTIDAGTRARRLLAATEAQLAAGAPGRAASLLEEARRSDPAQLEGAEAQRLAAELTYRTGHLADTALPGRRPHDDANRPCSGAPGAVERSGVRHLRRPPGLRDGAGRRRGVVVGAAPLPSPPARPGRPLACRHLAALRGRPGRGRSVPVPSALRPPGRDARRPGPDAVDPHRQHRRDRPPGSRRER